MPILLLSHGGWMQVPSVTRVLLRQGFSKGVNEGARLVLCLGHIRRSSLRLSSFSSRKGHGLTPRRVDDLHAIGLFSHGIIVGERQCLRGQQSLHRRGKFAFH